uniref:hypothetical protein n=1 Tax=Nocardia jinanensis TaxID=382504 RepID=UPI001667CDE1
MVPRGAAGRRDSRAGRADHHPHGRAHRGNRDARGALAGRTRAAGGSTGTVLSAGALLTHDGVGPLPRQRDRNCLGCRLGLFVI